MQFEAPPGGEYRIIDKLQPGGMSHLVLAERERAGEGARRVVLKRLRSELLDDDRYVEMFRAEAEIMSRLDHPNIVQVLEAPVVDGLPCLVLEYVPGKNVHRVLERCRELRMTMPLQVALQIACDVLRGLHYAHTFRLDGGGPLQLVHRDVTPGNLLVSFHGEVKITDFGIAKSKISRLTTTAGVVKGTTRYLSPEQIQCGAVTAKADLFSTAAVLVEMLTGAPLFERGSVAPTLFAIISGSRAPIAELLPFSAPSVCAVLERALAIDPAARPESAEAMRLELEAAAEAQGVALRAARVGAFVSELFPDERAATSVREMGFSDPTVLRDMASGARPLEPEQFGAASSPGLESPLPSRDVRRSRPGIRRPAMEREEPRRPLRDLTRKIVLSRWRGVPRIVLFAIGLVLGIALMRVLVPAEEPVLEAVTFSPAPLPATSRAPEPEPEKESKRPVRTTKRTRARR